MKNILILLISNIFLVACNESEVKHKTVSDYLHDIDSARNFVKLASTDAAKYKNNPDYINATNALFKMTSSQIQECWHHKANITSNTDHECLNKLGYKISN